MSASPTQAPQVAAHPRPGFRSQRAADRAMRRLLGVSDIDRRSGTGAHRAFRIAVVVSGIRCLVTYLAIPVLVPLLSLTGAVAAPIGIALCVVAVVSGVLAVRRFWRADHPQRWLYTAFMGVVFAVLALALVHEVQRWVVMT